MHRTMSHPHSYDTSLVAEAGEMLQMRYEEETLPINRTEEDIIAFLLKREQLVATLTLSPFDPYVFGSHAEVLIKLAKEASNPYIVVRFASNKGNTLSDFYYMDREVEAYCKELGCSLVLAGVSGDQASFCNDFLEWDILTDTLEFPSYGTVGKIIGKTYNV